MRWDLQPFNHLPEVTLPSVPSTERRHGEEGKREGEGEDVLEMVWKWRGGKGREWKGSE